MADQRMKYVPELEEERFQSMVAVPILDKAGEVMGVAVLHTAAPREFDDEVLNFLVHTASLVAGAIENAQLYEETRRRVQALTTLTELSQALAAVTVLRGPLRGRHPRGAASCWAPTPARSTASTPRPTSSCWRARSPEDAAEAQPAPGRHGAGAGPDAARQRARPRRAQAARQDAVARPRRERAAGGAAGRGRRAARDPLLHRPRPASSAPTTPSCSEPSPTRPRSG